MCIFEKNKTLESNINFHLKKIERGEIIKLKVTRKNLMIIRAEINNIDAKIDNINKTRGRLKEILKLTNPNQTEKEKRKNKLLILGIEETLLHILHIFKR